MIERVLVPLDGSETAETVLPHLRRLLLTHPAEVVVLQVVTPPVPEFHFSIPGQAGTAAKYLRKKVFDLLQEGVRARGVLREGFAADKICEVAREEGVSLIAMATHGRSGFSRALLGSVSESVLRESPAPVLLARSNIISTTANRVPYRKILVPLDGNDLGFKVLPWVKEIARPIDARLTLLAVTSPHEEPVWDTPPEFLHRAERDLAGACLPVDLEVRTGDPAEGILGACREHDMDLVAMATHGRSGPRRWILGSVTERVLRGSPIPLLVVRTGVPSQFQRGAPV